MATKKSASKAKVIKNENKIDLPPMEEVFESAKAMFLLTVETQIKTARRVDNLMNIRDYAQRFWGDEKKDLDYFKVLWRKSIEIYQKIYECSEQFTLEEFLKDEIKDYYAELIPHTEDIEWDDELCEAGLIWLSVQPYGQKLIQLHQLIKDEAAKREEL